MFSAITFLFSVPSPLYDDDDDDDNYNDDEKTAILFISSHNDDSNNNRRLYLTNLKHGLAVFSVVC